MIPNSGHADKHDPRSINAVVAKHRSGSIGGFRNTVLKTLWKHQPPLLSLNFSAATNDERNISSTLAKSCREAPNSQASFLKSRVHCDPFDHVDGAVAACLDWQDCMIASDGELALFAKKSQWQYGNDCSRILHECERHFLAETALDRFRMKPMETRRQATSIGEGVAQIVNVHLEFPCAVSIEKFTAASEYDLVRGGHA